MQSMSAMVLALRLTAGPSLALHQSLQEIPSQSYCSRCSLCSPAHLCDCTLEGSEVSPASPEESLLVHMELIEPYNE